jgi:hypothetical protein
MYASKLDSVVFWWHTLCVGGWWVVKIYIMKRRAELIYIKFFDTFSFYVGLKPGGGGGGVTPSSFKCFRHFNSSPEKVQEN